MTRAVERGAQANRLRSMPSDQKAATRAMNHTDAALPIR